MKQGAGRKGQSRLSRYALCAKLPASLSLPLLVLGIRRADHQHLAFAANDLALIANLFY